MTQALKHLYICQTARVRTVPPERHPGKDHASVKVVHQVVKMHQALVLTVLLDISQRLLQQQSARLVQEALLPDSGSAPVKNVLRTTMRW